MKKRKGLLITFEGIDGCGKSTQARKLCAYLKKRSCPVVFLREPGGTAVSEKIRRLLLDRKLDINPEAELFLYEAARAQITSEKIIPALRDNMVVICDRYFDSTIAYQGYGRRLSLTLIEALNKNASYGITPDLTFIFDVDYKTSLGRRDKNPDRLEKEKQAFFNRVRRGFKSLSGKRRVVMLDGKEDIGVLARYVQNRVERLLERKKIACAG